MQHMHIAPTNNVHPGDSNAEGSLAAALMIKKANFDHF
jgi:hypothetical protein